MKINNLIFLCFSFLLTTNFGSAATQCPTLDVIGLRCEFNETIEFFLEADAYEKNTTLLLSKQYDATLLKDLNPVRYQNGHIRYKLTLSSNQWTFLRKNEIPTKLTLIPSKFLGIYPHSNVYFYNIFNQTLQFKLRREEYDKFKNIIFIKTPETSELINLNKVLVNKLFECRQEVIEDDAYIFLLHPQHALIYPGETGLNLTLENY